MKTTFIALNIIWLLIAYGCDNLVSNNKETTVSLPACLINEHDTIINFENDVESKVSNGFIVTNTGTTQTNDWKIVNDNGNKVAAQLAKNQGSYYNLLVLDKPIFENFNLSVKIKSVSGEEDQGGGLVWRYIDNNNYYIARYNPLEKNLRFYSVINGNRKQLKSVNSEIKSGEWFTLSITMNGNKIICSLNGKVLIETTEDTFTKAGKVGFWTKADAISYFDDLTIQHL